MKPSETEEESSLSEVVEEDGMLSEAENIDPKVLLRIQKIANILNQTNLNLNVFERMLPAYRMEKLGPNSVESTELSELKSIIQKLKIRISQLERKEEELEETLVQSNSKLEKYCLENTKLTQANEDLKIELSDLKENLARTEEGHLDMHRTHPESTRSVGKDSQLSLGRERTEEGSTQLISALRRMKSLKQSRDSLKRKTKQLLRHYRSKRDLLNQRKHVQPLKLIKFSSLFYLQKIF